MWTSLSLWLTVTIITTKQIGYMSTEDFPEDGELDSIGLATKYGHPPIQYNVITEDEYILAVYRLPGKGNGTPILFTHGLMDSTDTFLMRGNTSLPITLANKGYDVWLANTRGNRYTRSHRHLDPDTDPAFWNFTFHEMGYYDLPAIIDLVLNETGAKNLTAIGHSQGNTVYYVLGSERPEYNSKVNVLIALAPMAYVHNTPPPVSTIAKLTPIITKLAKDLNIYELLGDTTVLGQISHKLCSVPVIGYTLCGYGLLYPSVGSDPTELEPEFFQNLAPHYPGGSSVVSLLHYLQVGYRKTFAQYDHGSETNQKIYNSSEPPVYQLDRVTMPIALFAAANDRFSSVADVEILRKQLPNVVYYLLNPRLICNHVDYVWGRTASNYLYPHINIMLNRYNPL
ncbi:lipase 1-like [Maniola jurtina]|uniref:lipase 1-like n=1 Tax=Maniola jurtina TaxID=191418 RepID=UPI001E68D6A3|nr:lipase 1-like [Maniola jurtina]